MKLLRFYSTSTIKRFRPRSQIKIFRKTQNEVLTKSSTTNQTISKIQQIQDESNDKPATTSYNNEILPHEEFYENTVKVQMISNNLHKQIFKEQTRSATTIDNLKEQYIKELKRHGIDIESTERMKDVKLNLPKLYGKNIEEHFFHIAKEQVLPYEQILLPLVNCQQLPQRPKKWNLTAGWTQYNTTTNESIAVEYPTENALIFDVEVCVREGQDPVIATAAGIKYWYCWVNPKLIESQKEKRENDQNTPIQRYTLKDLIPLGKNESKLIIGHNVSYDRARIREQYLIEDTLTRFLDTMSLHICVSGITSYQRAILKSKKETAEEDLEWSSQSSLNSLDEVHRLYCDGKGVSKERRNIFVEGNLADIKADFQNLVHYCSEDVEATYRVLKAIFPMFNERFPHPATLAGMLEMGSAYLPVNNNWLRYINESNLAYEDLKIESKYHLSQRANDACGLIKDEKYKQNLWLWNEDWSVQELKLKKTISKTKEAKTLESPQDLSAEEKKLYKKFQNLYDMKSQLPKRRPLLPGYPAWYRKLCVKPPQDDTTDKTDWSPGATEIAQGMQIAPKLLSLCWEGYPLHYIREHGWGFLVPFRKENNSTETPRIPIEELLKRCPIPEYLHDHAGEAESDYAFSMLNKELDAKLGKREFYAKPKKDKTDGIYKGTGVWCNVILQDCCYFIKLPHKNGNSFRVGNPLARDFVNKFSENVLTSADAETGSAARVIEIARAMSYWRNNRDRILGQLVTWLPYDALPDDLKAIINTDESREFGAICPQVVTCGTLTRRAMEPTWMTASNSRVERIGSELRSMIQAPPNYKIIGADVDSQELWIASVLGDAHACGIHGATPLGWMTLSGTKSNGTDMHSITAKAVGISRDHAKVINYARIYGAGQNFAESLLKQFNPTFSATEAKSKAMKMFALTKGKRVFRILPEFLDEYDDRDYNSYDALRIASTKNQSVSEIFQRSTWCGGTESAMFNRLESIATGDKPVTPFLNCRLSRALETNSSGAAGSENRFLPTRVNWVVQSGAVDFLHLMLVSMRWLMGSNIRFCLSFHDELRYLVKDEMAYKAALAMHITNLLTRSFCASRIGLNDLPMSVAFFASVEVDSVLRKESTMDCKTPSNPHGLQKGYGVQPGESLNIHEAIEKAGGNDLTKWNWIK